MPRKPINWANTIIYVIRSLTDPTLIYVGSTTDYNNRKRCHKDSCKSSQTKLYVMIRANGGWDSFSMVEHSKYPCENKRQAEKEEERIRLALQANLNTIRAFVTPEQRIEQKKEIDAKYYIINKVEIAEQKKEYRIENRAEINEKNKEYRIENKAEINEKQKENYQENKELILEKAKEKISCDCGCIVAKRNISTHRKTQKHIKLIKNNLAT